VQLIARQSLPSTVGAMTTRILLMSALTLGLLSATPSAYAAPGPASATSCVAPPIAHRGDSARAPENTLAAYRAALRGAVTRWELDVRFTADDIPVLMHDSTVTRTTNGSGAVPSLTLAQIRGLDAGSWFAARFAGVRVPTLYDVLDFGRTRGATFLIELKTRPTVQQMHNFLNRFRWLGLSKRVRVTSFDEQTILDVRAAEPGLPTGMSDYPKERPTASVLALGQTYMPHHIGVTKARMARWTKAGITVQPWPADTREDWRRLAKHGSGPVVTNRPHAYLRWARGFCSWAG
jgi:glycerophosphoryl diester phosphodiesterase